MRFFNPIRKIDSFHLFASKKINKFFFIKKIVLKNKKMLKINSLIIFLTVPKIDELKVRDMLNQIKKNPYFPDIFIYKNNLLLLF